jgi:hypothetical protein
LEEFEFDKLRNPHRQTAKQVNIFLRGQHHGHGKLETAVKVTKKAQETWARNVHEVILP